MTKLFKWLGGRAADEGNAEAIVQIAREVVERRRSVQGALNEVRHPAIIDPLAEEDFVSLFEQIDDASGPYREFAIILARLTHAAARAKEFDREIVDAAIALDSLLPREDASREREQLLRDAYLIAHDLGYVEGGRAALARLGQRAMDMDDTARARDFFHQQLDIGDESGDTLHEVESAIALGDLLRRDGDMIGAQSYYRRASRSGGRIEYHRGVAESLVRQIDLLDAGTSLETVAALQRQALDAAQRSADLALQSRIILALAETLARLGRIEDVVPLLETGVEISREVGDLSVESRCLHALIEAERHLGRKHDVLAHQEELQELEERLGNRPAAGQLAVRLGASYLETGRSEDALQSFEQARSIAVALRDLKLEQRALGGIGAAYTQLDQPAEALEAFMEALELARAAKDLPYEAQWLASIGQALWRFNQPADAVRAITEGLGIARRLDDIDLQASLLGQLGQLYAANGQLPRARECYQRAFDLYRRLNDATEQIAMLSALGGLSMETRQFQQATTLFEQALQMATERSDRATAARLHGRLGRLAQLQRDMAAAVDHYKRAVHFAETVDKPALLEQALLHLATAQHAVGEPSASTTYRRALGLAQQHGDLRREALIRLNLGILLCSDNQREEGLNHLYRAADLAEEVGPGADELAERIEDAISAAGGITMGLGGGRQDEDEELVPGGRELFGGGGQDYVDDEVYSVRTLPPQ